MALVAFSPSELLGDPEQIPAVTKDLKENSDGKLKEAKEDFTKPDEVEKVGISGKPDTDRQAKAPRATQENLEKCHHFVNQVLDENMRIRNKQGLTDPKFSVAIRGLVNPFAIMSTMAMPGEKVSLEIKDGDGMYEVIATGGTIFPGDDNKHWSWEMPNKPGVYCATVTDKSSGTTMLLHGMVKTPYDGGGKLEGYKIGEYKKEPLNGNPRYGFPSGFVKVTAKNADTWVSPHLQLKQFLCKQSSSYPSFVLLESRLLLKLETLLAKLREGGVAGNSLYITSAFRTPHYNRALGNTTDYSRHLYGDAADIFVDKNDDYRLDDLNKDGKVDDMDAKHLSRLVEEVSKSLPKYFSGGLGFYAFKKERTAFIHTDTRGYDARWGFD